MPAYNHCTMYNMYNIQYIIILRCVWLKEIPIVWPHHKIIKDNKEYSPEHGGRDNKKKQIKEEMVDNIKEWTEADFVATQIQKELSRCAWCPDYSKY